MHAVNSIHIVIFLGDIIITNRLPAQIQQAAAEDKKNIYFKQITAVIHLL